MTSKPREITREEANRILAEASKEPKKNVVICGKGKWYDIRGVSNRQVSLFISELLGHDRWIAADITVEQKEK